MRDTPAVLDLDALRAWPLPPLAHDADKEARGRVLVLAGSREIPGAAVLAATAALRVGAGKLVVATAASVATPMAFALPEARVIGLPETRAGGFEATAIDALAPVLRSAQAVLVGPGMMDGDATARWVDALLPQLAHCPVVLDALAMDVLQRRARFDSPVALTPHAGEMAHLCGTPKDEVQADALTLGCDAARRWNATLVLKGAVTILATPEGRCWRHEGGTAGLATSGSGDTLAGAIAGLAARGAPLPQACAWGVLLHAQAGERLAAAGSPIGFLARELPDHMMAVMNSVTAPA